MAGMVIINGRNALQDYFGPVVHDSLQQHGVSLSGQGLGYVVGRLVEYGIRAPLLHGNDSRLLPTQDGSGDSLALLYQAVGSNTARLQELGDRCLFMIAHYRHILERERRLGYTREVGSSCYTRVARLFDGRETGALALLFMELAYYFDQISDALADVPILEAQAEGAKDHAIYREFTRLVPGEGTGHETRFLEHMLRSSKGFEN